MAANAYLVADRPGGVGMLIDLNERFQPLLAAAEHHRVDETDCFTADALFR